VKEALIEAGRKDLIGVLCAHSAHSSHKAHKGKK